MPLIPFPDVPRLPGVPAIPRLFDNTTPATFIRAGLGLLQGALWSAFQSKTMWGIFDSKGAPLVPSSGFINTLLGVGPTLSTNAIEYVKETRTSEFPVERGGFAAYNKVETPGTATVTLCFQGSESERTNFLNIIDAACKSTDLYSVVTPEVKYLKYSFTNYNYQRKAVKGATLLTVDIGLREIREVSALYSQVQATPIAAPKSAPATPTVAAGKVQPKAPEQSVLKSLSTKAPGWADATNSYINGLLK